MLRTCLSIGDSEGMRLRSIVIVIVIPRFLKLYSKPSASLFMSAETNQEGVFQRGVQEKLRSDFQNTRRDRVAVKVGVVQREKVNDQMGQGRSV